MKLFNLNIKTITTFHNLGFDEYPANTLIKRLRKKIDREIVYRLFDNTTAVSTAVKKHYEKHFLMNDIDIIFNSFPLKKFESYLGYKDKNILTKYITVEKNSFIILTPGRFVEKKGHKYLIEAVSKLNEKHSNFIFLFVGKGPLESSLKKISPPNINFISEIEHSELMKIYNEVDLVVVPSVYEAFGLVVGEAMIMKKSIIATKVDGIIEMISEKEGVLVPPKDSQCLVDSIEKLYNNDTLRNTLAFNAQEKIKKFDNKIIAKRWKKYYEDILKK